MARSGMTRALDTKPLDRTGAAIGLAERPRAESERATHAEVHCPPAALCVIAPEGMWLVDRVSDLSVNARQRDREVIRNPNLKCLPNLKCIFDIDDVSHRPRELIGYILLRARDPLHGRTADAP
jgi:hypothetical protein